MTMKNMTIVILLLLAEIGGGVYAQDTVKQQMPAELANMILRSVAEKQKTDSLTAVLKQKLLPGTPSPDFCYKDIQGKERSLKDFRGNYMYIDVWATWCGPCKMEIPHLQRLEENMHGKKIVFVSISCDDNRLAWERMVKQKGLGGVQLQIDGDRAFMSAYGVQGIPRFILLDKKGRIVNAWMTRPSDPETEKTLLNLKGI